MRIGIRVVINVSNNLPCRRFPSGVARGTEPVILSRDQAHGKFPHDVRCVIRRAIVDDDHFKIRVIQAPQCFQCSAYCARAVAGADHDRDARPRQLPRKRRLRKSSADRSQCGLWFPLASGESEIPVFDVQPATKPFVRPGKDECARATSAHRRAHLPVQRARLGLQTVALAVESDLGHQQRTISREAVQPGEITFQGLLRFEINVEGNEIQEGQPQEFRGRIINIGNEGIGILSLRGTMEAFQEVLDATSSLPANHRCRDFVSNSERQHCWMPRTRPYPGPDAFLNGAKTCRIGKKIHMLLPRQPDEHAQPLLLCHIQQPARRHRVSPHAVKPVPPHLPEILFHRRARRIIRAIILRPEGAVGRSAHEESLLPHIQPFAADADPSGNFRTVRNSRMQFTGCYGLRRLSHEVVGRYRLPLC